MSDLPALEDEGSYMVLNAVEAIPKHSPVKLIAGYIVEVLGHGDRDDHA